MHFRHWFESLNLPKVIQSHKFDCGAAALRAVCQYYGVGPDEEDDYIKLLGTTEDGTEPEDIARVASQLGLKAAIKTGLTLDNLKYCLARKTPVICAIQAWGDEEEYDQLQDGHYVVAIGFDDQYIFFEDPSMKSIERGRLLHDDFVKRWIDTRIGSQERLEHLGIIFWKAVHQPGAEKKKLHHAQKIQ